jgi:sugar lactone lactonase YvrE
MHTSSRFARAALALVVAVTVGCPGTPVSPAGNGALTVIVTPADGTTPLVGVSGPYSYYKTISATQTLTNLVPGNYTIVADSVSVADSVVGSIIDTGHVVGSPAILTTGGFDTVTVAYSTAERLGGLWIANNVYHTIPELASSQLRQSGLLTAAETLSTTVSGPAGAALDPSGNLWLSSFSSDSLIMYSPAARNAGGATPPTGVIVSPALDFAEALAFDAHGNLWVANAGSCGSGPVVLGGILEYTAAQLSGGGTQTPTVAVTASAVLACPYGIAFDASGNAWVADDGNPQVVEFSAAQLTVSGDKTPASALTGGGLVDASAVTFDGSGNLWVANDHGVAVVEYTPAQLTAGGSPAPNVTIALPQSARPWGLVFDNRGTLWVSDVVNAVMWGLAKAQLASTGSPTPTWGLSVGWGADLLSPQQAVFDPNASAPAPSAARVHTRPIEPASRTHRLNANLHHGS